MKKILSVFILLVILAAGAQFFRESYESSPERIRAKIAARYQDLAKETPETIVYSPKRPLKFQISYLNAVPSLQIVIKSTKLADKKLELFGHAVTLPFFASFYKAWAEIVSVVDKDTFYPVKYQEEITYGDKHKIKEILFNRGNNTALRGDKTYKIAADVFCPLSAFFYMQLQDLNAGSFGAIKVFSKKEIYILGSKVVEEKNGIVKIEGQVKREDGSGSHGTEFEFWIDQELRIPLLFKVKTPAGLVYGRAI